MLAVYRNGIGRQRRELHRQVEAMFADEPDCPIRRIEAFCKLLDDASVFQTDPCGKAAKLRLKVFSLAASLHPLVQRAGPAVRARGSRRPRARLAEELGMPWDQIEPGLYADVMAYPAAGVVRGLSRCGRLAVPLQRRPASGLPVPGREHDGHGDTRLQDDPPLRQAGQAAARDRPWRGRPPVENGARLASTHARAGSPRHIEQGRDAHATIGSPSPARRRSCARPAATA